MDQDILAEMDWVKDEEFEGFRVKSKTLWVCDFRKWYALHELIQEKIGKVYQQEYGLITHDQFESIWVEVLANTTIHNGGGKAEKPELAASPERMAEIEKARMFMKRYRDDWTVRFYYYWIG